jgi:hypothetical protein
MSHDLVYDPAHRFTRRLCVKRSYTLSQWPLRSCR